jgi:RNA polymerase sigma-70 factor (ECF subfamily)
LPPAPAKRYPQLDVVAIPRDTTVLHRPNTAARDDRRALAGLRGGDSRALDDLYAAHGALVYRLAVRILGDADEAEEVVQDVFVYAWRNAHRYENERGTLESWLVTLARSRSIDRLRARASRQRRAEGAAREVQPAPAADPLHDALVAERGARVRAALAHLSPEQRQALEIAYWEGLSHSAIAARLDVPLGTIKTRIRQGMLRLRAVLDGPQAGGDPMSPPRR